jgi:segregation and condensation protein A
VSEEPQDGLLAPAPQSIRLPNFEGPLDLLLYLIRRNELDIYDIPIATVTRQYLDVLNSMEELSLEVAGDFFVMGATLMYIKSRMLVARDAVKEAAEEESIEDPELLDPRWELVQQLLEYRRIKEASEDLGALIDRSIDFLPREITQKSDAGEEDRPLIPVDRIRLWNLFNDILTRMAERVEPGLILEDKVTISDRMKHLLFRLETEKRFSFSSLFPEKPTINMIVATFLAVLELTRLRKLNLTQSLAFGDIDCEAAEESEIGPLLA